MQKWRPLSGLRILKKRKTKNTMESQPSTEASPGNPEECNESHTKQFQERPRICLIDLDKDCADSLKSNGFNCYAGTLGPLVDVPNSSERSAHQCLPNCDFPPNLHEYDIVVLDLQTRNKVPYIPEEHARTETKGHKQFAFVSSFPETVFDPRPLSASILESRLGPLLDKESIFIVFAAANEDVDYYPLAITARGPDRYDKQTHSLYDFYSDLPPWRNVMGKDTDVVSPEGTEITSLLQRHNPEAIYSIAFEHPTHWKEHEEVKKDNFFPLMVTSPDQIVSFFHLHKKNGAFFFPQIKRKAQFLLDFFQKVLPGLFPTVFPYSTEFAWLKEPSYALPNEAVLLQEKRNIQNDFNNRLKDIDDRIEANRKKHSYLHDLLTLSGAPLVKTIEKYFRWLGFENVLNVDETEPDLQEEDLRVETEKGLLVVEVKGLGGTSTDSECSQISKVKYRRSKQRGAFNVFALYIVNHQRFLPPQHRVDPPFNDTQIQDARNDERGLLTTYDLFKLYFNVAVGLISKEDSRDALFDTGLVQFRPSGATIIPGPYEIHHNGYVVVFQADVLIVRTGTSVVLNDAGRWRSAKVLEIQADGNSVEADNSGQVGIKLSERVFKGTDLWLRCET